VQYLVHAVRAEVPCGLLMPPAAYRIDSGCGVCCTDLAHGILQALIAHLYGKRNYALALACLRSWHEWACKQAKLTAAVVWWALNLMRAAFYGWLILERQIGAWGRRAMLRRYGGMLMITLSCTHYYM
jgi:hypothetical protein